MLLAEVRVILRRKLGGKRRVGGKGNATIKMCYVHVYQLPGRNAVIVHCKMYQ